MYEYQCRNVFFAKSKDTGLKYFWNNGYLNADNPKLAARYFLNAIDRVEGLKEKYQKNLVELENNITIFQQLVVKPFEKEGELADLKTQVAGLEREITTKIQKLQLSQNNGVDEKVMNQIKPSLVPKKRSDQEGTKRGLRA
jgi:hypothetical protein